MRAHEFLLEQTLDEVAMNPSALRASAAAIDARAGMEFEVIVPDFGGIGRDSYGELEPDYSEDRRAHSIKDVLDFFDGEDGYLDDREGLEASMFDDFLDWQMSIIQEGWENEGEDYFREWYWNNSMSQSEVRNAVKAEIAEENPDFDENSDEYKKLYRKKLKSAIAAAAEEPFADRGREYDNAQEEFEQDKRDSLDFMDWFDKSGMELMSEIGNHYMLSWPHVMANDVNEERIAEIADEFGEVVGKPVNYSDEYHSAPRRPGEYAVEPDGSLSGNEDEDTGLEFVSPPQTVGEMFNDLRKFKEWAGSQGIYTNESTGLHMNVSVPGYSRAKLDYVKLALLMGDEHVLKEFGRQANVYCKSALNNVKNNITQYNAADMLQAMHKSLEGIGKTIHNNYTEKYTSVHVKDNYVEFRSPGGDWLDMDLNKLENTLLRFIVALDAAIDPEKYKREYAKKLYKLLTAGGGVDGNPKVAEILSLYFANPAEATDSKGAVVAFARELLAQRKAASGAKMGATGDAVGAPVDQSGAVKQQ